ncbi:MAG: amidohydrolase family protein [Candidatus Thorarchaeota archaeon]|jgi:dihydropyrimidinase
MVDLDLIIKNGKIVTVSDTYTADIGVSEGKIVTIGQSLADNGAKVVDAKGKYVFPGGIDVHVHLQLPFSGTISADDFENGTKAAACGGVTTVLDFAIQTKGSSIKYVWTMVYTQQSRIGMTRHKRRLRRSLTMVFLPSRCS